MHNFSIILFISLTEMTIVTVILIWNKNNYSFYCWEYIVLIVFVFYCLFIYVFIYGVH